MAVNPMAMLKMKERLEIFKSDHPKVDPFFQVLREQTLMEGTVYEMKAVTPDGRVYTANIKLNANDIETIRLVSEAAGGARSEKPAGGDHETVYRNTAFGRDQSGGHADHA